METETSNPYESPKHQHDGNFHAGTNSLLRGLAFAVPLSIVGFAIPLATGFIIELAKQLNSPYANPPAKDLAYLFKTFVGPSIGCAIMFALASILNYSPALRLGLIRSLIFMGLSAFAGGIFMAVMTSLFNLEQQSYTSDPWFWLRVFLLVPVPVAYTIFHTLQRFQLSSNPPTNLAENTISENVR
jgi:hypothetical protein